jgi:acyl-CoA synthetase (AMP-forming)/AMP-acid ligase II
VVVNSPFETSTIFRRRSRPISSNRGLRRGDRVTLYAPNSWEWIVSYYGTLRAGAIINPINVMLTPSEVAYVTEDCGAKALIGSPEKIAPVLAAGVSGLTTIVFGPERVGAATPFDELVAKPLPFETVKVEASSTSTIGYTSGTTGRPKGAKQSHQAVMINVAMTAQMHLKTEHDVVCTALPCPHVYGNVVFQGALMYGLKLVLHQRFDASEMLASLEAHRATDAQTALAARNSARGRQRATGFGPHAAHGSRHHGIRWSLHLVRPVYRSWHRSCECHAQVSNRDGVALGVRAPVAQRHCDLNLASRHFDTECTFARSDISVDHC